jgi:hypothetical protein
MKIDIYEYHVTLLNYLSSAKIPSFGRVASVCLSFLHSPFAELGQKTFRDSRAAARMPRLLTVMRPWIINGGITVHGLKSGNLLH